MTDSELSPTQQSSSAWCWSGNGYARGSNRSSSHHPITLYERGPGEDGKMCSSPVCEGKNTGIDQMEDLIFTDEMSSDSAGTNQRTLSLEALMRDDVSSGLYLPPPTETGEKSVAGSNGESEKHKPAQIKILYISMQLCQSETLYDWLKGNRGCVDEQECLSKFRQMVAGLEYVHSQNLIHRDLKPANIFLSQNNVIKLGDFGLSRQLPQSLSDEEFSHHQQRGEMLTMPMGNGTEMTLGVGTPTYTSPEVLASHGGSASYTAMADIFSLGIILTELFHPFETAMERAIVLSDAREGKLPDRLEQECCHVYELLLRMLQCDPLQRPSAAEIAQDPVLIPSSPALVSLTKSSRSFSAPMVLGAAEETLELVVRTRSELVELPGKIAEALQTWCLTNGMPEPSPRWQSNVDGEEMIVRYTMGNPDMEAASLLESMFEHVCQVHPSLERDAVMLQPHAALFLS